MRITFLLPPLSLTGGIKVVAIHAAHLLKAGHTVNVFAPERATEGLRARLRRFLKTGQWSRGGHGESYLDRLAVPHVLVPGSRMLCDDDLPDADVVIGTWWQTVDNLQTLSRRKGVPVHFVQGHEIFYPDTMDQVKEVYARPNAKIAVSRWLQAILASDYGCAHSHLVENAVDEVYLQAKVPRQRPHRRTVGLLFSRASQVKGMDLALEVIRQLKVARPDLRVVGFAADSVQGHLDIPSYVEIDLDPKPERIVEIYQSCDVWVSFSRNEGFNLPVVEAMACGTPVVASNVGWPATGIIQGENGYSQPAEDLRVALGHIEQILSMDDEAWRQLSSNARHTVIDQSWPRSSQAFEAALQDICQSSR
jgi:glycosyltransferase involved in cell wall biosynthesis